MGVLFFVLGALVGFVIGFKRAAPDVASGPPKTPVMDELMVNLRNCSPGSFSFRPVSLQHACKSCGHSWSYDSYYCPRCFRDVDGRLPKDNI